MPSALRTGTVETRVVLSLDFDAPGVDFQRVGSFAHEESRLLRPPALNKLPDGVHLARSASLEKNRVIELLHVVHEMLMHMVI